MPLIICVRGESFDSEGSSEEYEDGEEEDYDEFNMEDSTALQIDKVRPDPRLRKHLTKAVKLGHKLMWGYEPKTKVMSKQRMETKVLIVYCVLHEILLPVQIYLAFNSSTIITFTIFSKAHGN